MCACKKENERGRHLLSPKEHMHSRTFPHPANTCLFEWGMRQVQQWMWRTRGRHQEPVTCWFGLPSLRKCQHIAGSQLGKCIPGRGIQRMCERSVDPESLDFAEGCNFCCRAQRMAAKVRVGSTQSTQGFKLRSPFFFNPSRHCLCYRRNRFLCFLGTPRALLQRVPWEAMFEVVFARLAAASDAAWQNYLSNTPHSSNTQNTDFYSNFFFAPNT